ncbi:MAG TPA: L,D-transpeptidase [Ktedonobacteraceae bacterium]|nr:L,D-transpeptidase [Ktedonobacteraceae bacterium]
MQKRYSVRLSGIVLTLFLLLTSCVLQSNASASTVQATAHAQRSLQADTGKLIVVSLSQQWLYAYENGSEVFNTAVMTGRPELGTPTGTYHVFAKLSPTTFYSPFPRGSAEWYPPTHIAYALEWKEGGYFLHDSWWHSVYGPGTNLWHYDPIDGWQSGSHGCISMPLSAAAWLYQWAPIGTTVQIRA